MLVDLYVPCLFLYLLSQSTRSIQSTLHWLLAYFPTCGKVAYKIIKVYLSLKTLTFSMLVIKQKKSTFQIILCLFMEEWLFIQL